MRVKAFSYTAALRLQAGEEGDVDGRLAEVRDLLSSGRISKVEDESRAVSNPFSSDVGGGNVEGDTEE